MKVALTGATGYIGSHVLTELHEHGHEVTALVRDDTQADIVKARGATPAVADLYDRPAVAGLLGKTDGAIHTASPGDPSSSIRLVRSARSTAVLTVAYQAHSSGQARASSHGLTAGPARSRRPCARTPEMPERRPASGSSAPLPTLPWLSPALSPR
jgi:uncharacterized protein YbjT (DUF2867 family)